MRCDVFISNRIATGIGTDPCDRLLYHVDSERRTVWQFDLDAADLAGSRRALISTAEHDAVPDGLAVAGISHH